MRKYIVYREFPTKEPVFEGSYEECVDWLEGCFASYAIEIKKEEK